MLFLRLGLLAAEVSGVSEALVAVEPAAAAVEVVEGQANKKQEFIYENT